MKTTAHTKERIRSALKDRPNGATTSGLKELLQVSEGTVTRACVELVEEGAVVRVSDPPSGRGGLPPNRYFLPEFEPPNPERAIGIGRGRLMSKPPEKATPTPTPTPTPTTGLTERDAILTEAYVLLSDSPIARLILPDVSDAQVELVLLRAGLTALRALVTGKKP